MTVKLWMVFEAVGAEEDAVEKSLTDHLEAMESEDDIEITRKQEGTTEHVEDPHPSLDEGYTKVLEIEADFDSFKKAINSVINYGPTYVQVEGPDHIDMGLKEAQETLQSVATTMHQYAQMGAGGVLISREAQKDS